MRGSGIFNLRWSLERFLLLQFRAEPTVHVTELERIGGAMKQFQTLLPGLSSVALAGNLILSVRGSKHVSELFRPSRTVV